MNLAGVRVKRSYTPAAPPVPHNWAPTERMIPGGMLKLHACTACKPAHVKAYDMEISSPEARQGQNEYQAKSQRR